MIKTDLSGFVVPMHSGLCEQYVKSLGLRPRDLTSCFASEQELDGEGDHGYHGDARRGGGGGVRTEERKVGVWIVVGTVFCRQRT